MCSTYEYPIGQEPSVSVISSGGEDPIVLFALACLCFAGLVVWGRAVLRGQERREARMRRLDAERTRDLSRGPDVRG